MSDSIAPILGRVPSGLFILSASGPDGLETGMLASWVQQAGFAPPTVTIAVNSERYIRKWIEVGSTIALSQLGEQQKSMLAHFGKGFEPGAPAFENISISRTTANLPVLTDSIGWMEAKVTGILESGDHAIVLAEITEAGNGLRFDQEKPFIHLRKNGLKY